MKKLIIIILLLVPLILSAQINDSSSAIQQQNLTTADSTIVDTTISKKQFDVDAVVTAVASDSLIFSIADRKMFVYGSGQINYKDTELKSGKIYIDYNTNELEAYGIDDESDTATVKTKQTPILKEGVEIYEGNWLRYNFKNQRGFISAAKNAEQGSRYEGEKVKKVDKNTYFIEQGMFTTCESDTPHTYFTASEMKVMQRDKIVAKWIFMHIGGVPFPIPLPFAVFPNESGRRSGLIIPTYGEENRRGQYFKNFGYFWAMSDYMDLTLTSDYYTRGGYGLRSRLRYVDRYNFSGNINGGFSKFSYGDKDLMEQSDWNLEWFHNQQINPTSRFDANLRFQSSNFFTNNSINYNDLLTQDIYSSANYSKIWDEAGASMNISYSRSQNLENGNITESLPSINFSKNTFYPFKEEGNSSLQNQKWYEMLALSYTGQFRNERRKLQGNLKVRGGVNHSLNMNVSPKIGYFNISPRINYQEKWYNKRIKKEILILERIDTTTGKTFYEDTVVVSDIKDINFVRSFDFSVSASTKLYGMMQPNILGIEAFRHTLTPAISYTYKPDFSSDRWNYYDSYTKSNGEVVRYDKYGAEIFGGAGSGESQSLSFSLGNVFEIKTPKSSNDTTGRSESNKIQLLNFNASVLYNFAAEKFKLSDLNLSYRTQIGQFLDLNGSSIYTFYDFDNNTRINKFLVSAGKGLFRLTSFSFSVSTSLSGEKLKSDKSREEEKEIEPSAFKKTDYISLYDDSESPDLSIPWDLSLSYNYNLSKPTPSNVTKYSSIAANLSFSLTQNWKFTMRGSYDFDLKQVITPQVSIFRDLHCWEMNFSWYPIGVYRGFHFEIRMKAPELQDIKVTKSRGLYSGRR